MTVKTKTFLKFLKSKFMFLVMTVIMLDVVILDVIALTKGHKGFNYFS
jgi:hypothetical protein